MAKKRDNRKKEEIKELEVTNCDLQKDVLEGVVTNCNHPEEVIANCDHLDKQENDLSQHDIEKLIITVRGDQVPCLK